VIKSTISRIPEGKFFGFITGTRKNQDYFFHRDDFNGFWEDLVRDVKVGIPIWVEFETEESLKGLRAKNVRRMDHPND